MHARRILSVDPVEYGSHDFLPQCACTSGDAGDLPDLLTSALARPTPTAYTTGRRVHPGAVAEPRLVFVEYFVVEVVCRRFYATPLFTRGVNRLTLADVRTATSKRTWRDPLTSSLATSPPVPQSEEPASEEPSIRTRALAMQHQIIEDVPTRVR